LVPSPAGATAIICNLDRPILGQLRDAVSERVEELIVHAPFHDADCAALQELIKSFAPVRVRLLLTDATSAEPSAIGRVLAGVNESIIGHVRSGPSLLPTSMPSWCISSTQNPRPC
jgi:hypothetical protein